MINELIDFIADFFGVTWKFYAFMISLTVSLYVAFTPFGILGALAVHSWVFILVILEWIRANFFLLKPKDGYVTSEARKKQLIEAEKERRKTRRVAT